jgi:hypothetical protein
MIDSLLSVSDLIPGYFFGYFYLQEDAKLTKNTPNLTRGKN